MKRIGVVWSLLIALYAHADDGAIYLMGSTPDGMRAEWLGWYAIHTGKPITTKNKLVDGRPVYAKKGELSKLIWFNKKSGRWYAGKARALGKAAGVLHVADVAMTPDKASNRWQIWYGPKRGWVEAPDMHIVTGAQGREIVDADAKALQDAAATVRLTGDTPEGIRHEWLGIYERRPGTLVSGRPSYVKRYDDAKLLWYYAPTGTWLMGGAASLGKAKGVLMAHDGAVVPERIRPGAWLVGQGQGRGWLPASSLRWLHGIEAEAAKMAEANLLQSSARTVYLFDGRQLVGTQIMPANMAPAWQGAYTMEMLNASQTGEGGRARYVKGADASGRGAWALWYNEHSGMWLLGRQGKRRAAAKAMLSVYDGAQLPNQIRAGWRKWQSAGNWEPVAIRCLVGVEGAAVLQEQSAASARVLASSASTVQLVGLTGPRHEWLGSYARRAGSLVNGRHSFVHEDDEAKVMWYDDRSASWRVATHEASSYGREARFHPNKAALMVTDPALVPERVLAAWMLRLGDDRHGGEDEAWIEAKSLRCIAGQDANLELQAQARELRLSGNTVYLVGAMPASSPSGVLGPYDMRPSQAGKDWRRRVYVRRDNPKILLSYRPKSGDWSVERFEGSDQQSSELLLSVYDGALLPERVSSTWRAHTVEGYWEDVSTLQCRAGPEGKAAMEADLAAVSLQRALTPGWPAWIFAVRAGPVIAQVKLALQTGLQPWRIHAALSAGKARGVSEAVLKEARKILPPAYPPSPPPPMPAPVASPPTPALSPPPPSAAAPPPVAETEDAAVAIKNAKHSERVKKAKRRLPGRAKGKKRIRNMKRKGAGGKVPKDVERVRKRKARRHSDAAETDRDPESEISESLDDAR